MIKVFIDQQMMQSVLSGLVDEVKSKIGVNLNYLKKRCKEKYGIEKIEGIEHKDGNMVVYKDQIACQLNYEVRFPMSVLITTKENINSTSSQNNDIDSEVDAMPQDLDAMPEEFDDIRPELDLDDLEPQHDAIDELIDQPQMGMYKKKM